MMRKGKDILGSPVDMFILHIRAKMQKDAKKAFSCHHAPQSMRFFPNDSCNFLFIRVLNPANHLLKQLQQRWVKAALTVSLMMTLSPSPICGFFSFLFYMFTQQSPANIQAVPLLYLSCKYEVILSLQVQKKKPLVMSPSVRLLFLPSWFKIKKKKKRNDMKISKMVTSFKTHFLWRPILIILL